MKAAASLPCNVCCVLSALLSPTVGLLCHSPHVSRHHAALIWVRQSGLLLLGPAASPANFIHCYWSDGIILSGHSRQLFYASLVVCCPCVRFVFGKCAFCNVHACKRCMGRLCLPTACLPQLLRPKSDMPAAAKAYSTARSANRLSASTHPTLSPT